MKNKKVTQYILLVFVLGVWGTIFYKIYLKLYEDDAPALPAELLTSRVMAPIQVDTFRLLENYNDPFLHKLSSGTNRQGSATPHPPAIKTAVKTHTVSAMPQVRYMGLIKNNASKKMVALISINGKSNLMREGESVENIKLLKALNDSVCLSCGKQKFYIRRN